MNNFDFFNIYLEQQEEGNTERYLNPSDIYLEQGYGIDVFVKGLDSPVSMLFTDKGELIVAESGITSGNARILKLVDNTFEVLSEGFNIPITGVNYLNGIFYVSHRGFITRITPDGIRQNIITGLPSNGDFFNGKVVFGPNNKLYFGLGTATNSGVVGQDNLWVREHPLDCDYPGDFIMLYGQNFETNNLNNEFAPGENVLTGAYSPYGIPNSPNELRKGYIKASGSILRSNLDGTNLELYAWGFRNPLNVKFDQSGQLYTANIGYDNRGSRPIANAPDEFFNTVEGIWYGWPDFAGGEPINLPKFTPASGIKPVFLIKNHPNTPPTPFVTFPMNTNIMGFDFDMINFGTRGDIYIAEFGSTEPYLSQEYISYAGTGHRISKIDVKSRTVSTFAMNKSGFPSSITKEGGFGRPADVVFGPDKAMYVLDVGLDDRYNPSKVLPKTGVIWRIYKLD